MPQRRPRRPAGVHRPTGRQGPGPRAPVASGAVTTDQWGVDDGYLDDAAGGSRHRRTPCGPSTGRWGSTPGTRRRPSGCASSGAASGRSSGTASSRLEDGTERPVTGPLPPDMPLGYHELRVDGHHEPTRLIVSPDRCHLPDDLHTWGLAVQLYAARSRASWGMGDLADLRQLNELVPRPRRRGDRGQPAARRVARRAPGAEPVLPEHPPVDQPSVSPRRGGAGGDRGTGDRRAGGRRTSAQRRTLASTATPSTASSSTRSRDCGGGSPARPTSTPSAPSTAMTSPATPRSAPSPSTIDRAGRPGRRSTSGPTPRPWPASPPSTPIGCASTPGCSGCSTASSTGRAPATS